MPVIKNLIFDLGAVLLNLDTSLTERAFAALIGVEQQAVLNVQLYKEGIYDKFETGDISEREFVDTLMSKSPVPVTEAQVRKAWSAMLLDFPKERINLLKELKQMGFGLYLFSNTNSIHLTDFRKIIADAHDGLDLDTLFDEVYYSHLIGMRKPNPAAFTFLVNDAGIQAHETLFVDDKPENVEGAIAAGLQARVHPENGSLHLTLADIL